MPQPCLVFTRDTADSPPGIPPDQTMVGPMSGICEVVTQFWPVAGGLHFISKIIGRQEQKHTSDNLEYDTLDHRNDRPIENEIVHCKLELKALKTLYSYFCKVVKSKERN